MAVPLGVALGVSVPLGDEDRATEAAWVGERLGVDEGDCAWEGETEQVVVVVGVCDEVHVIVGVSDPVDEIVEVLEAV